MRSIRRKRKVKNISFLVQNKTVMLESQNIEYKSVWKNEYIVNIPC